jgi:hypothetical protein
LKAQKKPHWRSIDRGLHIGYYKGGRGGAWVARRYCGEGRYQETALGTANDTLDADGNAVLNFTEAQAKARLVPGPGEAGGRGGAGARSPVHRGRSA